MGEPFPKDANTLSFVLKNLEAMSSPNQVRKSRYGRGEFLLDHLAL